MKGRITAPLRPRRSQRFDAALPVRMAGGIGLTRNVSVDGIYFEMDAKAETGSEISFDVDLETPMGRMTLHCNGLVVRTETHEGRAGIAVRIVESRLEAETA